LTLSVVGLLFGNLQVILDIIILPTSTKKINYVDI